MIHDMFNRDRPLFVCFEQDRFRIGQKRREQLRGVITDMLPARKRFEGRKMVCWSNDGLTGRHGDRCALCRDRWTCAERIRLMLLLDDLAQTATPAILEIGHGSFDALDKFVDEIGAEHLKQTPVCISLYRDQGRLRFSFRETD